jgi:hypothetical protein
LTRCCRSSFYTDFNEDQKPSSNTRVWLAATAYNGQHYTDYRPVRTVESGEPAPERPIVPNSYSALLSVGQFAGMVVSWLDAVPSVERIESEYAPAVLELLTGTPVTWPPRGGRLDFAGLDDLADTVVPLADVAAGRPTAN